MVLVLHFRRTAVNRTGGFNTDVGALALDPFVCHALFTSPLLHNAYRSGQAPGRRLVRRLAAPGVTRPGRPYRRHGGCWT
ncbi:hypothetical protein QA942_25730 [Streptomyces sp. B21-106]